MEHLIRFMENLRQVKSVARMERLVYAQAIEKATEEYRNIR